MQAKPPGDRRGDGAHRPLGTRQRYPLRRIALYARRQSPARLDSLVYMAEAEGNRDIWYPKRRGDREEFESAPFPARPSTRLRRTSCPTGVSFRDGQWQVSGKAEGCPRNSLRSFGKPYTISGKPCRTDTPAALSSRTPLSVPLPSTPRQLTRAGTLQVTGATTAARPERRATPRWTKSMSQTLAS